MLQKSIGFIKCFFIFPSFISPWIFLKYLAFYSILSLSHPKIQNLPKIAFNSRIITFKPI